MKILIAESRDFAPEALERLRRHADVEEANLDRAALIDSVRDVDVLWVRLRHRIDADVMDAAPRLRVIVTNTTGTNHIAIDEAARRGIRVLSLRGETEFLKHIRATAELTLGLLLALVRHLPAAAEHARAGSWDRYPFKGHQLFEKTAGIVGYGRLGRIVGRYLLGLGMQVVATTRDELETPPDAGITLMPLEALLAQADVVTLHVDLRDDNRNLMGPAELRAMKRGAWLINTARGELVDETALIDALATGHLAGAALDVVADPYRADFEERPIRHYASQHRNLILTPHIGGYTFESLASTELFLTDKLLAMLVPPDRRDHDPRSPAP